MARGQGLLCAGISRAHRRLKNGFHALKACVHKGGGAIPGGNVPGGRNLGRLYSQPGYLKAACSQNWLPHVSNQHLLGQVSGECEHGTHECVRY